MVGNAVRRAKALDDFARCHSLFVEHYTYAVGFAWAAAAGAALYAPWLRNIRGLIDPLGRQESTASFLFCLPVIMTLAWVSIAFGGDLLRRSTVMRSHALEFIFAGIVAFAVFCLSIHRAVVAVSLWS